METAAVGDATRIAREAYARGYRNFIAVGGDGTSYEIVNGLFPGSDRRRSHLPSDFFRSAQAIRSCAISRTEDVDTRWSRCSPRRTQSCDVLRLRHHEGVIHYINLLSIGFPADVCNSRARRFAGGEKPDIFSIFLGWRACERRPFPLRVDRQGEVDRRRCLFLTFNNSKFTGGTMMIAPKAKIDEGLIEYVRWGPIGRIGLIRNLSTLIRRHAY